MSSNITTATKNKIVRPFVQLLTFTLLILYLYIFIGDSKYLLSSFGYVKINDTIDSLYHS